MPKHQWPKAWQKYKDPVCPLKRALYGHPDSGGFWEEHCHKHLLSVGFKPIDNNNWKTCYWHEKLKVFLVVYVDDFRMSGPESNIPKAWAEIRKGLKLDEPERITAKGTKYLGCTIKKYKPT